MIASVTKVTVPDLECHDVMTRTAPAPFGILHLKLKSTEIVHQSNTHPKEVASKPTKPIDCTLASARSIQPVGDS